MSDTDKIYYARRAAEEMELAKTASNPSVARTHEALLRQYLERASVGDRQREESPIVG